MSLINDALNRARAEAARREAEARGEIPPPLAPPPRRSLGRPVLWGLVALTGVAVAALVWLGRPTSREPIVAQRSPVVEPSRSVDPRQPPEAVDAEPPPADDTPTTADEATAAPPPRTSASAPTRPSGSTEESSASSLDPAADSEPPAEPTTAPVDTAPTPPRDTPLEPILVTRPPSSARRAGPSPAAGETATTPAAEAPAAEAPATIAPSASGEAETWYYVGSVTLPGGASIELGGIAWSARSPSAVLNGSLLREGDEILGLTIVEIARRTVVLDGRGQRIALQLGASRE